MSLSHLRIRLVLLTVCVSGLTGCFLFPRYPLPQITGSPLSSSSSAQFLRQVAENSEKLHTFRGLAVVQASYPGGRDRFRQVLVFEKPDKLRWEAFPLQGAYSLNVLVLRGETLTFLDQSSSQAVIGTDCPEFVQEYLGLPLPVRALGGLLTGQLSWQTPVDEAEPSSLRLYQDDKSDRVIVVEGDFERYAEYERLTGILRKVQIRKDQELLLEAHYNAASESDGIWLPREIEVIVPAGRLTLVFSYSQQKMNTKIASELFELQLPEARIERRSPCR